MQPVAPTPRSVFLEAVESVSPDRWPRFVEEACAGDETLRQQVLRLLNAHQAPGTFMAGPAVDMAAAWSATIVPPSVAAVGTRIGPYKLLEQIGEGGMGIVYVAEQTEPIRRRVALKIIKPGMDSRQVIARFEAERQALALMDHPNIATVLDAGVSEPGLPYFVMELVRGMPITDYCDSAKLSPDQRIELFVAVCQAVQHAHQKGIIHRDLKPSNVLVTLHDGKPVPKVIDFGVAKAVGPQLSDHTVYTSFTQMVGTPLYMSPEQAELSGLDIDTRSDVYSLGVLLYELLTGQTPFDSGTFFSKGLDEMRRIIREDEPPRPSHRVSTLKVAARSTLSANRGLDERRLSPVLSGELDWIVMKSLEKERDRRYESVSALSADLQRYLADEPVLACPPSLGYRLRKTLRRHKGLLTMAGVLTATLLVATGISLAFAVKADHEEQVAERRLKQSRTDFGRALKALDTIVEELSSAEFAQLPGADRIRRDVLQKTMSFYQEVVTEHDDDPYARQQQAVAWCRIAIIQEAVDQPKEAVEAINRSVRSLDELTTEFPDSADFRHALMASLFHRIHSSRRTDAEQLADAERALSLAELSLPSATREQLPGLLHYFVKVAERLPAGSPRARTLLERSVNVAEERGVDPSPGALIVLAKAAEHDGRLNDAVPLYRRGIGLYANWGANPEKRDNHIERWLAGVDSANLGRLLVKMQRPAEAEAAYGQALRLARQVCRDYGRIPRYRNSLRAHAEELTRLLAEQKRGLEAEAVLQDLLKEFPDMTELHDLRADHLRHLPEAESHLSDAMEQYPTQSIYIRHRGIVRREQGRYAKALEDLNRARDQGGTPAELAATLGERARLHLKMGHFAQADTDCTEALHHSKSWHLFKLRGSARFHEAQFQPALVDLREAVTLNPKDLSNLTWIPLSQFVACADPDFRQGFLTLVDESVTLNNRSAEALITRASILMEFGETERAQADFDTVLASGTASCHCQYQAALLALTRNNLPRYRMICREMLTVVVETLKPDEASFAAWTCSLSSQAIVDYAHAIQLAERAVASAPDDPWNLVCLGAVRLRSGQPEQALESLEKAEKTPVSPKTSLAYVGFFQALALHQLDRIPEGQLALIRATEQARQELNELAPPVSWNRRATLGLLRAEAETLLRETAPGKSSGQRPPPPPLPEPADHR